VTDGHSIIGLDALAETIGNDHVTCAAFSANSSKLEEFRKYTRGPTNVVLVNKGVNDIKKELASRKTVPKDKIWQLVCQLPCILRCPSINAL
jgi:hypothetical protein